MRDRAGLDALDAVRAIEALDDGRHRVAVDGATGRVAYLVTLERTGRRRADAADVQGQRGASYPSFRLVDLDRGVLTVLRQRAARSRP